MKRELTDVPALVATGLTQEQAEAQVSRFERTFLTMQPWLPAPEAVRDFLDIGCGLGGVAMWCSRHFPRATAHLIDGETLSEKWVSYRAEGQAWADVNVALRLYAKHCPGRAVKAWPPDPALTIPAELIYSTCSWGHHYAIETYLGLVQRSLKPGGTLIVDLRKGEVGEHGERVLAQHFALVAKPSDGKKYVRTVWRRA